MNVKKNKSKGKAKSSQSFHLYKGLLGLLTSSVHANEVSKLNPNELSGFAAKAFGGDYDSGHNDLQQYYFSQQFKIASDEMAIMKGNVPCIFPESKKMLDALNASSYKFNKFVKLSFPMETFSLAMPKGIMVDDREIAGIYVQKGTTMGLEISQMLKTLDEIVNFDKDSLSHLFTNKQENQAFLDSVRELTTDAQKDIDKDKVKGNIYSVSMEFIKPNKKTNFINMKMEEHLLSLALKAENAEQLLKLVNLYQGDNNGDINCNLKEILQNDKYNKQAYYSLRTLASVGVYLSLDSNKLKQGLPSKFLGEIQKTKVGKVLPGSFLIESTKAIENSVEDRKDTGKHYRSFHFRNLKSEVYYRNQHKDKEIGSRWTFVSDSLVSSKDEAMTITT